MSERLAEIERRLGRRKAGLDLVINATRIAAGFRRPFRDGRIGVEDRRYVDFAALEAAVRRARRNRLLGGAGFLVLGVAMLLSSVRDLFVIGYVAFGVGAMMLINAAMLSQRLAYEAKRSAFDATRREPADEVALQDVEQRHHR